MSGETTSYVLALDVGGTKISCGLVDVDRLVVSRRHTIRTPGGEARTVAEAARKALEETADDSTDRLVCCIVASAGPIDTANGTVSPVNIPCWEGFPIVREAQRWMPGVPVRLIGDAAAMTLGEQRLGAGRGLDNVLGIVVSTGVGGGLVLDGDLHEGRTGNAGLIGHTVIDREGELCGCGRRGCVEMLASGPAIVRNAMRIGWRPASREAADARAVAHDAEAGDAAAQSAFGAAANALAVAVANAVALVELDAVIFGGGVANGAPWLVREVRDRLHAQYPFDRVDLRCGALGADAGLLGAALYATNIARQPCSLEAAPSSHA